jgi:hypothetical protein
MGRRNMSFFPGVSFKFFLRQVRTSHRARNPKRKGKGLQNLIWWFNSIPRLHLSLDLET